MRGLQFCLELMSLNKTLLHLLFECVKASTLPFIDALICHFHLARSEFPNRLLSVLGGLSDTLVHVLKVGLGRQLGSSLNALGGS